MIIAVYNNDTNANANDLTLAPISATLRSISLVFDTEANADAFLNQFPKSLGIKKGKIGGLDYDGIKFFIEARAMKTKNRNGRDNKVTGESNETGDKKIIRFHAAATAAIAQQAN